MMKLVPTSTDAVIVFFALNLDDMGNLSSFERHNRGRKFVVACSPCAKARGYKPRRCEEFPPLFAIPSCLTDRKQSLWKLPVDVVSKSFQDVVKVAQKLENAVQSVVGSDFHSPGM